MAYADLEFMREEVGRQYDNPTWRTKVDHMPERQLLAIYSRLVHDGTLHSKKAEEKKPSAPAPQSEISVNIYEQLSMFPPDRRSYKEDY